MCVLELACRVRICCITRTTRSLCSKHIVSLPSVLPCTHIMVIPPEQKESRKIPAMDCIRKMMQSAQKSVVTLASGGLGAVPVVLPLGRAPWREESEKSLYFQTSMLSVTNRPICCTTEVRARFATNLQLCLHHDYITCSPSCSIGEHAPYPCNVICLHCIALHDPSYAM